MDEEKPGEPLTAKSARSGTATSAKAEKCTRTALTHTQSDFGRCASPFCDNQLKVKPRGKHVRYCSADCRMDVYALRRAKALRIKVGIVKFFSILEGV